MIFCFVWFRVFFFSLWIIVARKAMCINNIVYKSSLFFTLQWLRFPLNPLVASRYILFFYISFVSVFIAFSQWMFEVAKRDEIVTISS